MRMTQLLCNTLRENPADAEVVSHQLLVRAGYIRKVASGIYNYLPLMWRVMLKVENIVREEMNRAGAQELLMPILQPADLWKESGRWEVYGKELIRLQDRHERDCVLAPTHEEVITAIAKQELKSYRNLPINLYQIQNKYRDEVRPRFGLLRGREFIMKDAYSFHSSDSDLDREYEVMTQAYTRIFERCGLETRMVRSDSGAIGGSVSHEFMVLTNIAEGEQESGENDIYYCNTCDYAANSNRAESILPGALIDGSDLFPEEKEVETPNCSTIESLSRLLECPPSLICKALLYIVNEESPLLVLIRGDLEVEETKVLNAAQAREIRLATEEEVAKYTGTTKGNVGIGNWDPIASTEESIVPGAYFFFGNANQSEKISVIFDKSVYDLKNFIVGINKTGYHQVGYNWVWNSQKGAEVYKQGAETAVFDLKLARVGDFCPECGESKNGKLEMTRGIEVGNIFKLGTKYSSTMKAFYADEDGTDKPFIMGCYGIGISRTAAAAVERFHDKWGIIWPMGIAPYHAVVIPVNVQEPAQMELANRLYQELQEAGVEVVMDDRDERAGVKFKDADLIGFPIRITAGKKAAEGMLECKMRDWKDPVDLPVAEVLPWVQKQMAEWQPVIPTPKTPASV